MTTIDNQLAILTAGQSDWDSDVDLNFNILERGYHLTARAGQVVSSGQVLTLNSGGFFFPYAPGSAAISPYAYSFTAAASGDSLRALAWGIVRSLDINSLGVGGKVAFSTISGFLSTATLGLPVGLFLPGRGVLFNPAKVTGGGGSLAALTDVNTNGVGDGKVLTWQDASSKWVPATSATGITKVISMSDVDPSGLANDSILKWSNASSKFTMQVDSAGGGGTDPHSMFTGVQSGGSGWDSRYSFGVTMSSSNVIATAASGGPYNHSNGGPARSSGKRYFEFIMGSNGFAGIGLAGEAGHLKNGDGNIFGTAGVMGQLGWVPGGGISAAKTYGGNINVTSIQTWAQSVHLGVAVDFDLQLVWFRTNTAGTWNNSVSANPSSGTGGIDLSWCFAGGGSALVWPAAGFGNTSPHALYVRSADIGAYIPVNFVAWDS